MQNPSVLVVDDDNLIGWALAKDFTAIGFPTHFVGTARDALERIRGYRYDFVFLDVHLPDGNGVELIGKIGAVAPGIKAVVMSASGGGSVRQQALDAGALQFLEKPFDVSDARSILRSETGTFEQKRRHHRKLCRVTLKISIVDPPEEEGDFDLDNLWGLLVDVGPGGVKLRTEYPLKAGQRVRGRPLAGKDAFPGSVPGEMQAEVVWVSRESHGVVAGLRFVGRPTPARTS